MRYYQKDIHVLAEDAALRFLSEIVVIQNTEVSEKLI